MVLLTFILTIVGISLFPEDPEASGQDLQSLFDYLVKRGLVKKRVSPSQNIRHQTE
jgi:hypothetical protein